jgi:RNA polymerase sigma-70 factor (ECF subfamily)
VSKRFSDAVGIERPPTGPPEPTTFDHVYASEFPFVWRCLRSLGVPPAALDDAAQDVFVIVHRQLAGFRGDSSFRSWLFGITHNVASNYRRGAQRKQAPLVALSDESPDKAPDPLEATQDLQAAAFVQRFMAGLPDDKRAMFVLGMLEELSMPEVAQALGIPLNTAYTRLRRVRLEFRQALDAAKESTS